MRAGRELIVISVVGRSLPFSLWQLPVAVLGAWKNMAEINRGYSIYANTPLILTQ